MEIFSKMMGESINGCYRITGCKIQLLFLCPVHMFGKRSSLKRRDTLFFVAPTGESVGSSEFSSDE